MAAIRADIAAIEAALGSYRTARDKIRFLRKAFDRSSSVHVGEKILEQAEQVGGPDLETLLIHVVENSAEVKLRVIAVQKLAQHATPSSIRPLLKCAENDPTGPIQTGCIRSRGNARRDAYFALAEIGLRLQEERKRIAESIQGLPVTSEDLNDPKIQTLYILTGNAELLKPFYRRLESPDPKTRKRGVVAFRFLKLKRAPKELVALIHDHDQTVRSWVALVLGEIGDPATVPVLVRTATNQSLDRNTRCNAIGSLGRMEAKEAKTAMQGLVNDESVKVNAAIALSRITGVRHPLVPDGYGLDEEAARQVTRPDAEDGADQRCVHLGE
jgi:HEAT repeat protein